MEKFVLKYSAAEGGSDFYTNFDVAVRAGSAESLYVALYEAVDQYIDSAFKGSSHWNGICLGDFVEKIGKDSYLNSKQNGDKDIRVCKGDQGNSYHIICMPDILTLDEWFDKVAVTAELPSAGMKV